MKQLTQFNLAAFIFFKLIHMDKRNNNDLLLIFIKRISLGDGNNLAGKNCSPLEIVLLLQCLYYQNIY